MTSATTTAQYFMPELDEENMLAIKEAYVIKNNGEKVKGKITWAVLSNGQLRSFTLKDETSVKHKFKAQDIQKLVVKPLKLANIQSAFSSSSIRELVETPIEKTLKREWVYFEKALLPRKKNKFVLMQLLNPGFDSKIKVYLDPDAKETNGISLSGIQLSGGIDKSYLVVKGGKKSMLIKKKKYKKEAQGLLYDDCPIFEQYFAGEKFRYKDFEEHVFLFDQYCK